MGRQNKLETPLQEPEKEVQAEPEKEVQAEPEKEVQAEPEKEVQAEPAVKVYNFTSKNPYLTVANLGIQFRDGKASTTNLNVAKALVNVGGVELIED